MSSSAETLQGRVRAPDVVRAGEPFQVRTLIAHPMETGYRRTFRGEPIPRHIVTSVRAWLGEELVAELAPGPAIAANPYFSFWLRLEGTEELRIEWLDDLGRSAEWRGQIEVESDAE